MKPAIPKGTRDFSPAEVAKRNYLKATLQSAFENFGFQPIETPSFEKSSTLLGKYGEEGDRLIFKILNSGEKLKKADTTALEQNLLGRFTNSLSEKALRYDLTVPFARYVVQHQNDISFPFKRYQIQPVWRADRPQHGRFQEFYQCDADIVGSNSLWQEVELCQLYDTVYAALGLEGCTIKMNNRKILAGISEILGVEDQFIDFTVGLDKLDKIGKAGVFKELSAKGFSDTALEQLDPLLNFEGTNEALLILLEPFLSPSEIGKKGLEEVRFVLSQIQQQGLKATSLGLDITLARGLNYYTGCIFEVAAPAGVKMGSIGGGGRYDDLTAGFGLKNMSGVGISFGFDRMYLVLEDLNLFPPSVVRSTQVLFANFGSDTDSEIQTFINQLRALDIRTEFYPDGVKVKKQLSYAHQKQIPYVVLMGSEEKAQQMALLKNMESGEQISVSLDNLVSALQSHLQG